jgi:hypothetical protein
MKDALEGGPNLTFLDLAALVLDETETPMTYREIWEYAVRKGYDRRVGSEGATPAATLRAVLGRDIASNPSTRFAMIDVFPTKFRLRTQSPAPPPASPAGPPSIGSAELAERKLHPFLASFAYFRLGGARVKTIHHERSVRGGYMRWVHPDLVGFTHPEGDWQDSVIELGTAVGPAPVTFLSFEVKRELGFENLGNAFFEAVSNSSWAHKAYLAAADVSDDEEFQEELQRLSLEHGIGVIALNLRDPNLSRELFPARRRDQVGWPTVDKLCRANDEFAQFMDSVRRVLKGGRIRESDYDPLLNLDALLASLQPAPAPPPDSGPVHPAPVRR